MTTLLSEKLISEATAMEAYGTPITENWMRDLFLTVLKSRASYPGDRELWLDVIGRVGEVYEQQTGVSDLVTILKGEYIYNDLCVSLYTNSMTYLCTMATDTAFV